MNKRLEEHNRLAAKAVASDPQNRAVYKYTFLIGDYFTITMPKGAQILHVEAQQQIAQGGYRDQACLWALVQPTAKPEKRGFLLVGTGHPISPTDRLVYVGTFMMEGGALVYHLFEKLGHDLWPFDTRARV